MNIITIKDLGNTYLVNDLISVPKDPLNKDYNEVIDWLAIPGNDLTDRTVEIFDLAKQDKILEIAFQKHYFEYDTITVDIGGDKDFSGEEVIQRDCLRLYLVKKSTSDWPFDWVLADGITRIALTEVDADLVIDAYVTRQLSSYDQQVTYLEAVDAAIDLDDIEAIVVNFV